MKKQVVIYVEPWLYNYLKTTRDFHWILNIDPRYKPLKCHKYAAYRYLSEREGKKELHLYMHQATLKRVYGLVLRWKKDMKEKMLQQAFIDAKAGFDVWTCLDCILNSWGIPEQMFKRDRAYKQWQRSEQYENYKAFIYQQEQLLVAV